VELAVDAGEGAVGAEGHGGDAHFVGFLKQGEGLDGVGFAGPPFGEFAGGDQIIDVWQDVLEALVDGVHIDGDGDVVAAGDAGGVGDGGGVVAVDVEEFRRR
jgi:hypothetical protein